MKISEVAELTGITVRTLHYYDEIGLLKPSKVNDNGYRVYDNNDLAVLQQILLFREMDFPLKQIKEIISNPLFDRREALVNHKKILLKKQEKIKKLINLVERTLNGDDYMSFKEFDNTDIENAKNNYAKEVKEKYGNTDAYKESEKKTSKYNKGDWNTINSECNDILKKFSEYKEEDPSSENVQLLVKTWKEFITKRFYNCTDEILQGLGQMYVMDERFKKNIDKNGEGTAEFISRAIEVFIKKNSEM